MHGIVDRVVHQVAQRILTSLFDTYFFAIAFTSTGPHSDPPSLPQVPEPSIYRAPYHRQRNPLPGKDHRFLHDVARPTPTGTQPHRQSRPELSYIDTRYIYC